jgi:hypothetical protein
VNTVGADNTANNAEGGVVSVTTAQRSIPPQPTSRTNSTTGSSSGGKTKNSSNRDCTSVAKSIQSLTSVMADRIASGGNNEMGGFATMQLQMMQQSQMQMQMQLVEMKEQGKQSLKFLKAIAKQGENKKRKGRNLCFRRHHHPLMTTTKQIEKLINQLTFEIFGGKQKEEGKEFVILVIVIPFFL